MNTSKELITELLQRTLQPRLPLLDSPHMGAHRILNGFSEGLPVLAVDVYGRTLVVFVHRSTEVESKALLRQVCEFYTRALPWVDCVIAKLRSSENEQSRKGEIIYGANPVQSIIEEGVEYVVDLLMNQDASFYLDTRNLRAWLKSKSPDKDVLNTFAYTGSLGVAALAGGASRVKQVDRSAKFLEIGRRSVAVNRLDLSRMNCVTMDFFPAVSQMKQRREDYDIVILDPPFFSLTQKGKVNQVTESGRLINKVRPLVRDGGSLVVINNALFLHGSDFIHTLEDLAGDGYLAIEQLIDVPDDVTGYADTRVGNPPADPAPFNHSTKIAVLAVRRK